MEQWRRQIEEEQKKEKEATEERKEIEKTEKGTSRARRKAQLKEIEQARLQKSDPAELIKKVKDMWVNHCATITGKEHDLDFGSKACEIFDVCAVSFFRNVRRAAASQPLPASHHVIMFTHALFFNIFAGTSPKSFGRFQF